MSSKSFARNNLAKNPENAYEPDTADDSDHLVSPKQKRKKKKKEKKVEEKKLQQNQFIKKQNNKQFVF